MPVKFERFERDGRPWVAVPRIVYDSVVVPAGSTSATATFTTHPETNPGYDLARLDEDELVDLALDSPEIRRFILSELHLDPSASWCLIAEKRCLLLPDDTERVPGDFDIIAGPLRDGLVAFDTLAEVEVKRRRVDAAGRPASTPSGTGTTQARGAARVGFDRVLLLHVLPNHVRPLPPGAAPSWASVQSGECFEAIEATSRMTEERLGPTPPCGYALVGWGTPESTDPLRTGSLTPAPAIPAPFRPLSHDARVIANRERLEAALRRRFGGDRRPGAPFFRSCKRCGRLFAPANASTCACGC